MSLLAQLRSTPRRISRELQRHATLRPMPGPPGHPVLGHAGHIRDHAIHDQLLAWREQYGPIYRCRIFHKPAVVVADPPLVRQVLRARPKTFRRLGTVEPVLDELGVNGVFSAEGDDWRRQRRLVMSAFGRSKLSNMQAMITMVTERLLGRLEQQVGRPFDIYPDLMRFTADVTTLVAFGYDLDSVRTPAPVQDAVTYSFSEVMRRLYLPVPYWRVFKLPRDRKLDEAIELLRTVVEEIIREGEPHGRDNLLRRMQQALREERSRRGLSEHELFSNVMTLLFAGEDTTANTLGWMVHLLAGHPLVQQRMRQQVDEVLDDAMVVAEPEDAAALRAIEAAFVETLRLRPVVPVMLLQTREPVTLAGYDVPAGVPVFTLLACRARDTGDVDDPDVFRPDRWESKIDLSCPAEGLHPFGGGPRVCPGRGLALLEVQTLIGSLLRRFELHPVPGARAPRTIPSFTWGPDRIDVMLKVRP